MEAAHIDGTIGQEAADWGEAAEEVVVHRDIRLGFAKVAVQEDTAAKLGLEIANLLAFAVRGMGSTASVVPVVAHY